MRKTIWTDSLQAAQFEKDGYLVIDFLSQEQVEKLKFIFFETKLSYNKTFYSSSFIEDIEKKQEISKKIDGVLNEKVVDCFSNFKKLGGVFLVKPSGPESIMPIHQDWTVVDESIFDAMTIWIPLQDTTEENGCIKILPKSHRLSTALRAPTLQNPLQEILTEAEKLMIPLPMKAGQAFVFSHALLHASFPNLSNEPRLAVAYGMLHQEAELLYYFRADNQSQLEQLRVSNNFFLNYPIPGERPSNPELVKKIHYQERIIKLKEFKKYYSIKESIFSKAFKVIFWKKIK
jgi:hypothetical protein